MKIILLKDVAKVGRIYETKEVADGYARNFIVARGWGLPATPANLRRVEALKTHRERGGKLEIEEAERLFEALKDKKISIEARANESGHLFAGLHEAAIAAAVTKQTGLALPAGIIELEQPIKTLGEFTVKLKTPAGAGELKLAVEPPRS